MILYIIRHGEPNYELDCLTEKGKMQAELVAKRLMKSKITQVYSSTNGRALETAEPFCRLSGLPLTPLDWAREYSTKYVTEEGVELSLGRIPNTTMRGAENDALGFDGQFEVPCFKQNPAIIDKYNKVADGGIEFLKNLGYEECENGLFKMVNPNKERVALFCHGNMGRTFMARLFHIPLQNMLASFGMGHTGVTAITFADNETGYTLPRCITYADVSHLATEGNAGVYNGSVEL